MDSNGIVVSVAELKEMLNRFSDETQVVFRDSSGKPLRFRRLNSAGESKVEIGLGKERIVPYLKAV